MTDEEKQKLQELSAQSKGTETEIGPFYRDEPKILEAECQVLARKKLQLFQLK